jgi:hypothetical protein
VVAEAFKPFKPLLLVEGGGSGERKTPTMVTSVPRAETGSMGRSETWPDFNLNRELQAEY